MTTLPTVPPWIAKAVIHEEYDGYDRRHTMIETTGWRAAKTQVIVTVAGPRGPVERRFRLSDLTEVGGRRGDSVATLVSADSDEAASVRRSMAVRHALELARNAKAERLDSSMDAEALVLAVGRMQRAATKALAVLADLL